MTLIHVIILAIVQGIGEFLPISSSAHLILVPYLFNFENYSLAFDVALHFGTLIAIILVFYKDWIDLFKGFFNRVIYKKKTAESRLFTYLVIATIPGALIGKLFEDYIEGYFRTKPIYIAIALAGMGILIYLGDKWAEMKYKNKETNLENITLKQSLIIGISQALAMFPGFSRSGTTIVTGRILGLSKEAVAKFSFLLATPIVFGAALLKLNDMINEFSFDLVIGIITATIFGIISNKFLLGYIKKHGFAIFAYYRIIFALIIIIKVFISK
jgi:undecaprenyl-diphosphatase